MTLLIRRSNVVADAALALLGAGAVWAGVGYGIFREGGLVGVGFLPAACGLAITILALLDLFRQLAGRPELESFGDEIQDAVIESQPPTTDRLATVLEVDIFGRDQKTRNRQLVIVISALILAIALVPLIGLLLALSLLMVFISIVVERRSVVAALIITVVTVALFYAVFVIFLGVPMPRGLLGVI